MSIVKLSKKKSKVLDRVITDLVSKNKNFDRRHDVYFFALKGTRCNLPWY